MLIEKIVSFLLLEHCSSMMVLSHDGKENAIVTEHLGSEDAGCDAAI
jgi:hypothetical protein